MAIEQERIWEETMDDTLATEDDARNGGPAPLQVDPKLLHDIEVLVSRLVAKAGQLIGNFTTNLAENWMSIRCKFEGGKVINRSQSGSWEFRCMGAGLRENLGSTWGPQTWTEATGSTPNPILVKAAGNMAKKRDKDRKRKSTEKAKESRRKSKYARTDDTSVQARRSYSRHDGGIEPDDVSEDISPEHLEQLCEGFYKTHVVVSKEQAGVIEETTRAQSEELTWREERRKRITASNVGGVAKMRKSTKRAKRVKEMLYTNFTGSAATRYGNMMEKEALNQYVAHQQQNGHPGLVVEPVGLCVSKDNPWLAASPDTVVHDPVSVPPVGLAEIKNPYSARDKTVLEFGSKSSSCLEVKDGTCQLKHGHDYYYQVQCQLYCTDKEWCDFIVRTEKDIHIERIGRDRKWWDVQMDKCFNFYFSALLPELACPRYRKGGIREPHT